MSNTPLRLVIFDVDGTLVDSQGDILASMRSAFDAVGRVVPMREKILSIVGLSLPLAMMKLAPDSTAVQQAQMVDAYKARYQELRREKGADSSPLYPGALQVLNTLHAQPDTLLGIATGKSKRGLDALIDAHGLAKYFITRQVADFHPSKPHPSMILAAMADAGVAADQAVMVGDTSFDMEMAQSAGICGIGVSWGYHARAALSSASLIIEDFAALSGAIDTLLGETA